MPIREVGCRNGIQDQEKYKIPYVAPCRFEWDGKPGICPDIIGWSAETEEYGDEIDVKYKKPKVARCLFGPGGRPGMCPDIFAETVEYGNEIGNKYKEPKVAPRSLGLGGKPGIRPGVDEIGVPKIMLCFKTQVEKKEVKEVKQTAKEQKADKYRKRAKSRELRAGILYAGCDCERRNGLQDKCPRSECQGSPECLTMPPTCPPSEFANGKHIAKTLWKVQQQQELEAKKLGDKNAAMTGKAGGKKGRDVHYDCFPIDLEGSAECPLCARALKLNENKMQDQDRNQRRQDMPAIFVGPINIGLKPDCNCCDD